MRKNVFVKRKAVDHFLTFACYTILETTGKDLWSRGKGIGPSLVLVKYPVKSANARVARLREKVSL